MSTKAYNTTEVHVKRIDRTVNQKTFNAICETNHLTPQTEARMENLLVPGSAVVPTRAETIEANSPGYEPPVTPVFAMPDEVDEVEVDAEPTPTEEAYEYD
jgi:hypothetical protein